MAVLITAEGAITISPLTNREQEVLQLVKQGYSQKRIAGQLLLSPETVKKHLKNCYKKLGAHNKIEALQKAGLI